MAPTTTYGTVAEVQALLNALGGPGITIGVASVPTTSQVESFLDQVAAEINSVLLGQGYSVPVTGTSDVYLVKRFLVQKVAAMTWGAGFMSDEKPAKVRDWEAEYQAFIDRIMSKQQRLIDTSPRARIGMVKVGRYIEG